MNKSQILFVCIILITMVGFQNCVDQRYSSNRIASQFVGPINSVATWKGFLHTVDFQLGSDPGLQTLNKNSPVWKSFYVDADFGDDNQNGETPTTPFKSIEKAKLVTRELSSQMQGHIIISLKGKFFLNEPIRFNNQDSGKNGFFIIYRSAGESQAIISGGQTISPHWTLANPESNIWMADSGPETHRNLYKNGIRVPKSRFDLPQVLAVDPKKSGFIPCANCAALNLGKPFPFEIVLLEEARVHRCAAILNKDVIEPDPTCYRWWLASAHVAPEKQAVGWLENSKYFLQKPGTWASDLFDPGKIFYIPIEGEDLAMQNFSIPKLSQLVVIENASNILFSNIQFSMTDWSTLAYQTPTEAWLKTPWPLNVKAQNFVMLQADDFLDLLPQFSPDPIWRGIPAAIECQGCHQIVILDSVMKNLGGAGIHFGQRSTNNLFFHNKIYDVSASAIQIGGFDEVNDGDNAELLVAGTTVEDNDISFVGAEFFGSPGIFQGLAAHSRIVHNMIHEIPHTGIAVGWGWQGKDKSYKNSHDNLIQANHIFNIMKVIQDGGGIYTLGSQSGTSIEHNYVHDLKSGLSESTAGFMIPFAHDIYLDAGSSLIRLNNNVTPDRRGANGQVLFEQYSPPVGIIYKETDERSIKDIKSEAGPRL